MADVESLQLQITGNAKGAKDSLDGLIDTLDRLKTATKGGCGLSAVSDGLKKVDNNSKNVSASNGKSARSFIDLGAKVTAAALALKKIGKIVASWIAESNDYIENVNLFTVAMGEYADSAKKYAEEVSDLMGIDPSDWMRSQGVFMTLATGFGVAGDRAATMSQQLTQLGYDISSFYNTSVEDAMTKLQSGISGEIEPLRRLGYDLSQAKLEATALSLGIDKAVSSMTQAEKAELRYYAIMTQVTTAQGDMARTLEAPANQMRVLQAQATQAARALGDLFIPALNAILPVAIAVLKVITALAKIIAKLFGGDVQGSISSSVGDLAVNAGSASDAIDDATGSAKKLKKMLLGIDELNVMSDTSGGGAGSDVQAGGGFDFELPTYDFIGDMTETRVAQIVEDMKEWLGITDDIDSWGELMDTRFGHILETVGLIGAGIAAWKIFAFIEGLKDSKLGELFADTDKMKTGGGIILGVVGAVMQLMGAWDAWQNGMDWENLGKQIAGIGIAIGGFAILFQHIGTGIASIVGGVILVATSVKDWIENGTDWDNFVGVMVGLAAIFGGISVLVGSWIPMAIGAVVATVVAIIMWWDEISAFFVNLWTSISTWCGEAWTAVSGFFSGLWEDVVAIWNSIPEWFDENVIQPVVEFFRGMWESIESFFSGLWDDIVAIWESVATWFDENVIRPVVEFFRGIWESVSGFFISLWEDIMAVWLPVATWFDENLIQPIVGLFEGIALRIGQFFEGCWIIIQAIWIIVSTWFNKNVVQPVVEFFRFLWEEVSGFFSDLWDDIVAIWELVSTWFDENVIQPVVDFFKALWNTVSQIFSDLWEGIKMIWNVVSTWFNDNVIQPVVRWFSWAREQISAFFSRLWDDIVTVWNTVSAWFDKNVIQPVIGFFRTLWESVSGFFSELWADIVEVWNKVSTWFDEHVIQPVVDAWNTAISAISQFFVDLWESIKRGMVSAMNAVIGGIEKAINWIVDGLNRIISGFNKVVDWAAEIVGTSWGGVTLVQRVSLDRLSYYADGGFPTAGEMFIANEAGPELVGSIGNRSAVVNNDQIVESVSKGVYQAVVSAMGQSGGPQVVEAKVNDKVLFEVVVDRNRRETMRTGFSPLLGGA